ncbi:hypothetical protein ABNN70_05380 [Sporolactobacillus sp. Y61]|uniref:Uncharacterized protein n=1 Tax=Sporolactobacillus sp. Y61 TaxID=3160863 RepID=A0AAU8II32_9BACL
MDSIKDLFEIWKKKGNLFDFKQEAMKYMYQWMCRTLEDLFARLDWVIVENKLAEGGGIDGHKDTNLSVPVWPGDDPSNTHDSTDRSACYLLDDVLKLKRHMRYSPHVEYETARLATQMTGRQVAEALATWTPV